MRISLHAFEPVLGDIESNIGMMVEQVREAASQGSRLAMFPEMALTGYSVKDAVRQLAMDEDHPAMDPFQQVVKETGTGVVFGYPERSSTYRGLIHNSARVIVPDGAGGTTGGSYRKWHPVNFGPFEERHYFRPGDDLPLFELPTDDPSRPLRFGVVICYDIFFPELTKTYALKGADLFVVISAAPMTSRRAFESVCPGRAVENTCYLAYINLAVAEGNLVFWGGPQVHTPKGVAEVGPYYEPSVLHYDLDLDDLAHARTMRPTLNDTRMHLWEHLTKGT